MTTNYILSAVQTVELERVVGGAAGDWNSIKEEARPHCPQTVDKYGSIDPKKVTRPLAEEMGNACLAEMGPGKALFARGKIHGAIDKLFPPKK